MGRARCLFRHDVGGSRYLMEGRGSGVLGIPWTINHTAGTMCAGSFDEALVATCVSTDAASFLCCDGSGESAVDAEEAIASTAVRPPLCAARLENREQP